MPSFSPTLEVAIHASLKLANDRRHELATLEHLLLGLLDEVDANRALRACDVDIDSLRSTLLEFIDDDLSTLVSDEAGMEAKPTAAFQRVIQRAAIHIQTSGREVVDGANVLIAIFAERESNAAYFLQEQDVTRYDVVNFYAHGVAKNFDFVDDRELKVENAPKVRTKPTKEKSGGRVRPKAKERFIFLSYSSLDRQLALSLKEALSENGLPIWWDQDIPPGSSWRSTIKSQLETAACVLTIWTENSIKSDAVIEEASFAQSKRSLVHLRISKSTLPYGFAETQYVDMRDWDGVLEHPQFRRLVVALKAQLTPPTQRDIKKQLLESSPVKAVVRGGKLSLIDRPEHVPPSVIDPDELSTRLVSLVQLAEMLCTMLSDRNVFQASPCAIKCLQAVKAASSDKPVTWYSLEDCRDILRHCMDESEASNGWNKTLFEGVCILIRRIDEVRPFLQPRQISPNLPFGLPQPPIARISTEQVPQVLKIAETIQEAMADEVGDAALNGDLKSTVGRAVEQIQDAASDANPNRRLSRLRANVTKLVFVAGGVTAATGAGVIVNLLTSPDAALVLSERLRPLVDALLKLFM